MRSQIAVADIHRHRAEDEEDPDQRGGTQQHDSGDVRAFVALP
jgi:hypothetical protein